MARRRLGRYVASVSGGELISIPAMRTPDQGRSLAALFGAKETDSSRVAKETGVMAGLYEVLQRLSSIG